MKKNIKISMLSVLVISLASLVGIQTSIAQTLLDGSQSSEPFVQPEIPTLTVNPESVKEGEIGVCSDYYKNGSVDVEVQNDFQTYQAGDPIVVTGTIKNNNSFPVIGATVKARLVKDIPEADPLTSEYIILDEFDILSNKTLDTQAEVELGYSYVLPFNAPSGEYKLLFYVVENNSFDISGINYTDNITAAQLEFTVEGEEMDHVYLDQTQIMIGDQSYNTGNPFDSYQTPSIVTIPLYNASDEEKEMRVTYSVHSWDSLNPIDKLDTKTEIVTVSPESEYTLTYTLASSKFPVAYLTIVAEPVDQSRDSSVFREKTIANIRLTDEDVSMPRIDYVGIDTYPLKRNMQATLVTCFSNISNQSNQTPSRIETVLLDQNQKEIARIEYEGVIVPETITLIEKFKPRQDISSFTIISRIYDNKNNLIDSVEKKYDCKDINSSLCTEPSSSVSFLITIISLGLIMGIITLLFKRKDINSFKV